MIHWLTCVSVRLDEQCCHILIWHTIHLLWCTQGVPMNISANLNGYYSWVRRVGTGCSATGGALVPGTLGAQGNVSRHPGLGSLWGFFLSYSDKRRFACGQFKLLTSSKRLRRLFAQQPRAALALTDGSAASVWSSVTGCFDPNTYDLYITLRVREVWVRVLLQVQVNVCKWCSFHYVSHVTGLVRCFHEPNWVFSVFNIFRLTVQESQYLKCLWASFILKVSLSVLHVWLDCWAVLVQIWLWRCWWSIIIWRHLNIQHRRLFSEIRIHFLKIIQWPSCKHLSCWNYFVSAELRPPSTSLAEEACVDSQTRGWLSYLTKLANITAQLSRTPTLMFVCIPLRHELLIKSCLLQWDGKTALHVRGNTKQRVHCVLLVYLSYDFTFQRYT